LNPEGALGLDHSYQERRDHGERFGRGVRGRYEGKGKKWRPLERCPQGLDLSLRTISTFKISDENDEVLRHC